MKNRISEDQIDFSDEMVCLYKGKPFTGVVFDEDAGQVIGETQYKDGMLDGITRTWFRNRQLRSESCFVENRRHGPDKEWYESGVMKSDTMYEHGIIVKKVDWDLDGKIIKSYELMEDDPGFELLELRRKSRG
ncbi:hypothetical protein [uncultured Microbulbifer sp.]|uniref:toxin-antitoxin system YwqK family antitoxin n=1 Tax=uncultured Microbulbifer sp. TaxID=348147 RepID=UPI002614BA85|nr:hypothetical protein [uncultured Microbulbifer sp.]